MGSEVVKHLFKATTDLMHGIINVNVTEVGRCDSACNWCFESFNLHPKKGTDWQFKNVPIMNQSNCFISIRVMVDMEAIPGTPGTRPGHTLNPAAHVWELLHSIVYLLNCTGFNKTRNLHLSLCFMTLTCFYCGEVNRHLFSYQCEVCATLL